MSNTKLVTTIGSLCSSISLISSATGILIPLSKHSFLLWSLGDKRTDSNRLLRRRIQRDLSPISDLSLNSQPKRARIRTYHSKCTSKQHILIRLRFPLLRRLRNLNRDLHTTPPSSKTNLASQLQITDLAQWMLKRDSVYGCCDCHYRVACVFVGNHAGKGVEIHEYRPETNVP